jgi:hypothetical protein
MGIEDFLDVIDIEFDYDDQETVYERSTGRSNAYKSGDYQGIDTNPKLEDKTYMKEVAEEELPEVKIPEATEAQAKPEKPVEVPRREEEEHAAEIAEEVGMLEEF